MLTKTCTRCNGTGEYSYNLRDGRRCYGCEGKGVVPMTPKAKGVKATALIEYAEAGDICKVTGIGMVRIIEVLDGEYVVNVGRTSRTPRQQDAAFVIPVYENKRRYVLQSH